MDAEEKLNGITEEILGAAMAVHTELGPGLLESAYEACLVLEMTQRGLKVERQKPMPLRYRGHELDVGYRLDLLVEGEVIVEVKAVEAMAPVHGARLLSYLRLSGCQVGLLLNFNVKRLREGIKRVVNEFPGPPHLSAVSAFQAVPKEDE